VDLHHFTVKESGDVEILLQDLFSDSEVRDVKTDKCKVSLSRIHFRQISNHMNKEPHDNVQVMFPLYRRYE